MPIKSLYWEIQLENKPIFHQPLKNFWKLLIFTGSHLFFMKLIIQFLPSLHEHGFNFFKLGEEAHVDLDAFTLSGKKMKGYTGGQK